VAWYLPAKSAGDSYQHRYKLREPTGPFPYDNRKVKLGSDSVDEGVLSVVANAMGYLELKNRGKTRKEVEKHFPILIWAGGSMEPMTWNLLTCSPARSGGVRPKHIR